MTPSVSSASSGPVASNSTGNKPKKSLSQLIRLRDSKRALLSQLFEEKKKIMEQENAINGELYAIDDEIEAMEEERDRQRLSRRISPQQNLLQVKPEPVASNPSPSAISPPQASPPLTMNPDELLTEPTQTSPMKDRRDDELLTDPLTYQTQAQDTFQSSFAAPQQKQPSAPPPGDDIDDYYYDSGDDHAEGPPVNNSSIVETNNTSNESTNNFHRTTSAALPPLQFESVTGPRPPAANQQRSEGAFNRRIRNNHSNPQHSSSAASSCPYSQHDIYQTLRQSFRLQSFRENQLEIIQSTLSGKDNFVLMKTGGGKSLLYQLPAVLESPKVTVVVSPLLSLIQDQEDQMNGFVRNSCVSFTSGMGASQHNDNWRRVRDVAGGIVMILVTPERVFKSNKLRSELQNLDEQNRLGRFVIDECHCACQVSDVDHKVFNGIVSYYFRISQNHQYCYATVGT